MADGTRETEALLKQIPLQELAKKFDVDQETMDLAVRQTLPALLGGMAVNASEEQGATKLAEAVGQHTPAKGAVSLEAVDPDDGKKIVKHVLGDKEDAVAKALGQSSGNDVVAGLVPKLLPLLAPLVMQFLAGNVLGGSGGTVAQTSNKGGLGGVLGDMLGGLIGGGSPSKTSSSGGLGELLGGSNETSGGLGDMLGGLLGGMLGGKK